MGLATMIARLAPFLLVLLSIVSAPAASLAEEWGAAPASMPARARVLLPGCEPPLFDAEALLGSLRLELLGSGVELLAADGDPADDSLALLAIEAPGCEPQRLTLRVERPRTGRSATREVDLTDRPPADRGRVLALSIAELLRARWASLAADEVEQPGPEAAPPPTVEVQRIDEDALRRRAVQEAVAELERRQQLARWPDHRVLIGASVDLATYPVHASGLLGGRLFADIKLARTVPLHLAVDAGYRAGGGSDALGRVETQSATGGLALRWQGESERLRGGLGPRLELGWTRIEGDPVVPGYEPGRADGFVLALALDGVFELRLSRRLWMVAGLSLGYVLVGLDARSSDHHVGGVAGPLISASLGVAVGL